MYKFLFSFILSCLTFSGFTQTYSPTGYLNKLRCNHESQVLNNGNVLIFGGDNYNFLALEVYKSCELFNPNTNIWTYTGSMNYVRDDFASAKLNNGKVIAIGGLNESNFQSTCEIYDPNTETWDEVASMNLARYDHNAIKLNNGNILVAGNAYNDPTTEIYYPSENKWLFSGNMNLAHGKGMTLTMLFDGRVLAVGGELAPFQIEIYSPQTGKWDLVPNQLLKERYDHCATLLPDGKVLISGSGKYIYGKTCEIFDPISMNLTLTGSMATERNNDGAILVDGNKLMVFGLGELFEPFDTKIIEVYDISTGTWSHKTYSSVGTSLHTIDRLNDGRILVTGGTFTTGNGAINGATIISFEDLLNCANTSISTSINNTEPCLGESVSINLTGTDALAKYSAFCGSYISDITDGGGNISLNIPYNKLALGENAIQVIVLKPGCYTEPLDQISNINVSIQNPDTPTITELDTIICENSSVTLYANATNPIIWSNQEIGNSIVVAEEGFYSAQTRLPNNCFSSPSNLSTIKFSPPSSSINAGNNFAMCKHSDNKILNGQPNGGYWTGPGIVNQFEVSPALLDSGLYTIYYHYCDATDSLNFTVHEIKQPENFNISVLKDTICTGESNKIYINNANPEYYYSIFFNENKLFTGTNDTSFSYNLYNSQNGRYSIRSFTNHYCFTDTLKKDASITVIPYANTDKEFGLVRDTICTGDFPTGYILNPEIGINYFFERYSTDSDTLSTNVPIDTLFIPFLNSWYANTAIYLRALNNYGCKNSLKGYAKYITKDISVDYSIPEVVQIGDTVTTIKNSNADSTKWEYSPSIDIITKNDSMLSFTSLTPDSAYISLTGYSRYGCIRDNSQDIFFLKKETNTTNSNICYANVIKNYPYKSYLGSEKIMATHVDINGYLYISTSQSYYRSGDLITVMNINKIAPDGSIAWSIYQDEQLAKSYYDYFGVYCHGITTDSIGNVYITGSFNSKQIKFDDIIIGNEQYSEKVSFYCAKFNPDGKILWGISSEGIEDNIHSGTDIKYLDEETIFISIAGKSNNATFTNGDFDIFKYREFSLIRINSKGEYIENYLMESDFRGDHNFIKTYRPFKYYSYIVLQTITSPKLTIHNDTLHLSGHYNGTITFNNLLQYAEDSIAYVDFKFSIANKSWAKPFKINFAPLDANKIITPQHQLFSDYYFLVNNSINKYNRQGSFQWNYNIPENLNTDFIVPHKNGILAAGTFDDYLVMYDGTNHSGVANNAGLDIGIINIDTSGSFIGIDNISSFGHENIKVLQQTNNDEFILIGNSQNTIFYNQNKIIDSTKIFYIRNKINSSCNTNDYPTVKFISPLNNSIKCDSVFQIQWYSLSSEPLLLSYRLKDSLQRYVIANNIHDSINQYNWKPSTDLYETPLYLKISNSNGFSDSTLIRILPMESEKVIIDTILCMGEFISYDFQNQYTSYKWQSGEDSSFKEFISPTNEIATVTNKIGCKGKRIFNIEQKYHLLKVDIENWSGEKQSFRLIKTYKLIDGQPIFKGFQKENRDTDPLICKLEPGEYYVESSDVWLNEYFNTFYPHAFIMSAATKIIVDSCAGTTEISIKLVNNSSTDITSNRIGGIYLEGSCRGLPRPDTRVFLVSGPYSVISQSKTYDNQMYNNFNLSCDNQTSNKYFVFDEYPLPKVLLPYSPDGLNTYFFKNDTIFSCPDDIPVVYKDASFTIPPIIPQPPIEPPATIPDTIYHIDPNIITIDSTVITKSINDIIEPELAILPNPAIDNITIKFICKEDAQSKIILLNSQGKIEKILIDGKFQKEIVHTRKISIETIPSGIYFCYFINGETIIVKKLIIN